MEKIIIQSKKYSVMIFFIIMAILDLFVSLLTAISAKSTDSTPAIFFKCLFSCLGETGIITLIIYLINRNNILTVTNHRIYVTGIFKRRTDIPLDSVTSVHSGIWRISVKAAGGRVGIFWIKNRAQIHSEICTLLLERQKNTSNNDYQSGKTFTLETEAPSTANGNINADDF